MYRFALCLGLIVVLPTICCANDDAKAIALLKGVERERLKYDCFHIRYEEYRAETGQTSEQIVDYERGKIRKEHLPSEFFRGMKSILLEDVVYYMGTYDAKHVAIVPHQSINAYGAGVYDPRMLGLIDMMSHKGDVGDCFPRNRPNYSVSRKIFEGHSIYVVECQDDERNGFARWMLYIKEPDFHLLRKTVEAEWGKVRIDNDYSNHEFLPFPTKVHIYRVAPQDDGEDVVVFDRYFTVKDVQIKKSFPSETFTLAALNPPLNSDVVDYRIDRVLGYWDGEKIVDDPVSISAQELRELMEGRKESTVSKAVRYSLTGIGVIMILYALFSMYRKRRLKE